MPGSLVEYARFVEAQQRRARIVAERSSMTAARPTATTIDEFIDVGESMRPVDPNTPPGTVDVR